MRDLISLIENTTKPLKENGDQIIDPAKLTMMIKATVNKWLKDGTASSVREIGNGLCYEFCSQIFENFGLHEAYIGHEGAPDGGLTVMATEFYWKDEFVFDANALRNAGEPVPTDIPEDVFEHQLGGATHEWIKHVNGMHYDATCPEGAPHFLMMPFFANQIEGLRKELEGKNISNKEEFFADRYPDRYPKPEEPITEIYRSGPEDMSDDKVRKNVASKSRQQGWKKLASLDGVSIFTKPWEDRHLDVLVVKDRKAIGFAELIKSSANDIETWIVVEVGILSQERGNNYGKAIYNALLDSGLVLTSGGMQTPDGQRMWKWLISRSDIHTYLHMLEWEDTEKNALEPIVGGQPSVDPWNTPDARIIASKAPLN